MHGVASFVHAKRDARELRRKTLRGSSAAGYDTLACQDAAESSSGAAVALSTPGEEQSKGQLMAPEIPLWQVCREGCYTADFLQWDWDGLETKCCWDNRC